MAAAVPPALHPQQSAFIFTHSSALLHVLKLAVTSGRISECSGTPTGRTFEGGSITGLSITGTIIGGSSIGRGTAYGTALHALTKVITIINAIKQSFMRLNKENVII